MEFRVEQHVLANLLFKTQGIVDKKSTLNVLAHVLIESDGKEAIRVSCTDYDVALIATYPAEILEAGAMAVNGKKLFEVVKSLPNEPVTLKTGANNRIDISCARSAFKLVGIPPEDFPEQKEPERTEGLTIDRQSLLRMVDKTIFSVSHDESRMNLNGVYFKAEPHGDDPGTVRVSMVSTDGHRLSRVVKDIVTPEPLTERMDAIVHRKGIFELRRVLDGEDESVQIASAQNNMVIRYENTLLFVRQIEDSFPEYDKVIPASPSIAIDLPLREFQGAITRTATLTSAKVSGVKLALESGKVVLSTNNPDYGEARVEIDVDYTGDPVVVGFNYRYILDVLGVIEGEMIQLKMNDEFSPGLLESEEDQGATFVVMPMRI